MQNLQGIRDAEGGTVFILSDQTRENLIDTPLLDGEFGGKYEIYYPTKNQSLLNEHPIQRYKTKNV